VTASSFRVTAVCSTTALVNIAAIPTIPRKTISARAVVAAYSVVTIGSAVALVALFRAFVNVNTTEAVTAVSDITCTAKASRCVSASRISMAVVVIKIALIDVVTEKAIANVPAITLTCVTTKVVIADRVNVTYVVGGEQTFVKVRTGCTIPDETLFAGAVEDARSSHVAVGIN